MEKSGKKFYIVTMYKMLFFIILLLGSLYAEGTLAKCAITTIPKSGTHFLDNIRHELHVDVPMTHFALRTDESWSWWGKAFPQLLRKPEEFSGKTVVLVRDLRDIMPSAVLWLIQCSHDVLNNAKDHDELSLRLAREFLDDPYEKQLMKTICLEGMAKGFMTFALYSCDLIVALLKKPESELFVVRFEDIIGSSAGGHLDDPKRFALLAEMVHFLGYERSVEEVAKAAECAFGKGLSYTPVQKKVGRWQDQYTEEHKKAFEKHWGKYNQLFGY